MVFLLACSPLIVALGMLFLRQSSLRAGLFTLAATLLIVVGVPAFSLPSSRIALAAGRGLFTSLSILAILGSGFLLYHLIRQSGAIRVATRSLTRLCPDHDIRLLLLVLGLCPFVEAISGFGLGIVIIVPLLLDLGCDATQAAMLALLGQLTSSWGAMGVATQLGAQLSGLPAPLLGAHSALLLAPVSVSFGLLALVIAGGTQAVGRSWLPAVLAGTLLALGEWSWSQFPGVDLAGLLTALSVLAVLLAWGWRRCRRLRREHQVAFITPARVQDSSTFAAQGAHPPSGEREVGAQLSIWRVLAPYLFLTGGLLLVHLLVSLLHVSLVLLASPGVWVAGAAGLAWPLLRLDFQQGKTALVRTLRQFLPAAGAISSFLITSSLMSASGMTFAIGGAAGALGSSFLWLTAVLGAFSGWMTGSVLGGNAMFLLPQQAAAVQLHLPVAWIVATQNAISSIGRMLSPTMLILAASTAQLPGGEGLLLRKMGLPILAAVLASTLVLVGIVTSWLSIPFLLGSLFLGCMWLFPSVVQPPVQGEQGV